MISDHPLIVMLVIIVMLLVAIGVGSSLRRWREENTSEYLIPCPQCHGSGFSGYGSGYDAVCDWCGGLRQVPGTPLNLTKSMEVPRVAMHNRFLPDEASGPARDSLLADQILGDQAVAHEKPGARVNAPAPGEPGYVLPHEHIEVPVGDKVVILRREGPPILRERTYADIIPNDPVELEVPEPWEDIVALLAFEIYRLREGF